VIFHLIVAGFLVYSGVGALKALTGGDLSLATLEGAMTAVKSREIQKFLMARFGEVLGYGSFGST